MNQEASHEEDTARWRKLGELRHALQGVRPVRFRDLPHRADPLVAALAGSEFELTWAEYPDLELLEPQFAGGTAERAAQLASDLMAANPDLDAIIAVASSTCPGVAQAIETAGKSGKVMGTGYCSPNTARGYLKSGSMGYTVLWDPGALGYLTVWAGKQLIDGTPFEAMNEVPTFDAPVPFDADTGILLLGDPFVFTAENVDNFDF